jgi:branched-chain amino acid transport system ATP-binding protein
VLRLDGIEVAYGVLQAVRGVSLEVREGEIVSVIGSNGAGKTTTLRAVSGLLPLRGGRITLEGDRIDGRPPRAIVERGIGHVPEGRQLFPSLTVQENLEMGARTPRAKAAKVGTLRRVFELFPRLEERKHQAAGTLSGGEQQMVAIGRGLMSLPKLLMLDEPSLGLSPLLVSTVFQIVAEINRRGTAILLVEQNVFRALTLCHRAYVLENGEIVLAGSGHDLLRNEALRRAYLGL